MIWSKQNKKLVSLLQESNLELIFLGRKHNQYVLNNLNEEFRDYTAKELIESYEDELNKNWEMCLQIEKYLQAVTQTERPDYIYA